MFLGASQMHSLTNGHVKVAVVPGMSKHPTQSMRFVSFVGAAARVRSHIIYQNISKPCSRFAPMHIIFDAQLRQGRLLSVYDLVCLFSKMVSAICDKLTCVPDLYPSPNPQLQQWIGVASDQSMSNRRLRADVKTDRTRES